MKRRAILSLLAGLGVAADSGKAQKKQLDPDVGADMDAFNDAVRALDRPVPNGMCPVCGTDAEPFKPIASDYGPCGPAPHARVGGLDGRPGMDVALTICTPPEVPKFREVRCAKCSAAFFQDAE